MTHPRYRYTTLLVLVALSVTGVDACSSPDSKGSVTILAPWTGTGPGTEGYAFRKVLEAFTAKTGIHVNYQDTRALPQVLLANVQAGTPPDVAVLSSPGELAKYVRNGQLYTLKDVIDDEQWRAFRQPWLLRQREGYNKHIYTVPVKANLKSIIWFNPTRVRRPAPQTLDELMVLSRSMEQKGDTPWCMGMSDPPSSGWPGTDLIEDIFLHRFGPKRYQEWAAGDVPWTSNEVREAWTMWGEISVNLVYGGPRAVLLTDFDDAGRPMFTDPPGCFLEHQASFIMGFYQQYPEMPRPGIDFDFFPFPGSGSTPLWAASADLAGMFKDTPEARQLMRFLAMGDTQRIWPTIAGGSAFAVNKNVDPGVYSDEVSKRIAEILQDPDILCFDASDLMPATMRNAYYRAVLEYVNNPSQLDTILERLDRIRAGIPPEDWLNFPCGRSALVWGGR